MQKLMMCSIALHSRDHLCMIFRNDPLVFVVPFCLWNACKDDLFNLIQTLVFVCK